MQLPINEKLMAIRIMSYFSNGEIVKNCISVFLQFTSGWYKIVLSDGKSIIEPAKYPEISEIDIDEEFCYPISVYNKIDFSSYGKLRCVYEFLWLGKRDECCGVVFEFDKGLSLYVVEDDDETMLTEDHSIVQKEWQKTIFSAI